MFLNAPYLWGGRTPFGIDCSGFTQMVYRLCGYQLLRDAKEQATQGEVLSFIEESEAGDLAFFDNDEGEHYPCRNYYEGLSNHSRPWKGTNRHPRP